MCAFKTDLRVVWDWWLVNTRSIISHEGLESFTWYLIFLYPCSVVQLSLFDSWGLRPEASITVSIMGQYPCPSLIIPLDSALNGVSLCWPSVRTSLPVLYVYITKWLVLSRTDLSDDWNSENLNSHYLTHQSISFCTSFTIFKNTLSTPMVSIYLLIGICEGYSVLPVLGFSWNQAFWSWMVSTVYGCSFHRLIILRPTS